jgi:outer membrane protein
MLAVLLAAGTTVGPAHALDLSSAVRSALAFDAEFLAARKLAEAEATKPAQGLGLLLPSAVATAARRQTDFSVNGSTLDPSPDYSGRYSNTYTLTLTQPIFRLDSISAYQQLRSRALAGQANLAQARADAMVRTSEAYFAVLLAQDTLASIDAELKAITEQLESAKRNFEVGTATITDQQEAQSRFDLAAARRIAATNDLEVKRNALAQLTGMPMPRQLLGLKDPVSLREPQPMDAAQWVEQARSSNFRVQAATHAAEIARNEVTRVIYADNLPSVDLVARRTRLDPYRAEGGQANGKSETDVIGLELTLPLFNGGTATNRAREVIALRDKSGFDLENARRIAEQTARTSFLGVLAGLAQAKAYEAAETSSRLALESNRLGYEVGVRINIDVLNAQQQLTNTLQNLYKARYDTLINGLKLKAAVGTLSESDIDEINALMAKASP